MKRSVTAFTLLLTSVSAILGSGWLFSAYYTAQYAGPSALLSWLIAGFCVMFVAFVFAELNAMLPIMGASTRIPQVTHGTLVGFMYSWIIWVCYAAIPPTEVQAVIQYMSFYYPALTKSTGGLTEDGYVCATILMIILSTFNAYSLRWLLRCNTTLTLMKIIIPILIIAFVFAFYFNPHHIIHPANSDFMPMGVKGMLSAISAGGIIYAFNGFTQACELGGAVKKPAISLPIAIVGSVFLTLLIYLGLQATFLTSLTHRNLFYGWQHISLTGGNSPFAAILHQDGFEWLIPILFVGAIIGPLAAGLIYASGAAQSLKSKSMNGYLPSFLQILSSQNTPIYAILVNFLVGMMMFAPLPGWNKMISFLTSLMTLTYTIGPICLIALRDQAPTQKRPLKLPFGNIWGAIAFYICTVFSYFNGWEIISKMGLSFIAGLFVLLIYRTFSKRAKEIQLHWRASIWIWPYIGGLTLISYLGSIGTGKNILPFGLDLVVIAVFCIFILLLAKYFKLPSATTQQYIEAMSVSHH